MKWCSNLFPHTIINKNLVENAIQPFKDHFIAILCRADKSFPLNLWDKLLPQAEHTLNMLWSLRMTPTILAYAYLWKQHNYNNGAFPKLIKCKIYAYFSLNLTIIDTYV